MNGLAIGATAGAIVFFLYIIAVIGGEILSAAQLFGVL